MRGVETMRGLIVSFAFLFFLSFYTYEAQYATKRNEIEQTMAQMGFKQQSAYETLVHNPHPTLQRYVCDDVREMRFILSSPRGLKNPKLYLQRLDYQKDWLVRWASVEALGMWIFIKGGRYSPQVVHLIPPMKRRRRLEQNKKVQKALDWCIRETIKRADSSLEKVDTTKESWFGFTK